MTSSLPAKRLWPHALSLMPSTRHTGKKEHQFYTNRPSADRGEGQADCKTYMEMRRTGKSKTNLEKEAKNEKIYTARCHQAFSYNNKMIKMACCHRWRDVPLSRTQQRPEIAPSADVYLISDKCFKLIQWGQRRDFSINGSGTTGYPQRKNKPQLLSQTTGKTNLKVDLQMWTKS